ncbi:MAG: GntR family transcriptional regulator [Firmicutes bacterium]|nr:GntR family transcriptional regulator [Bacillota bacterium]
MISFDDFKAGGDGPLYLQIIDYIKRGAVAGTILDGDELPSRRVVSALLGINPNTVQKAFAILEEEGLMESRTGARSCMTLSPQKLEDLRIQLLSKDIRGITESLKAAGIGKDEALALISRYWDGTQE